MRRREWLASLLALAPVGRGQNIDGSTLTNGPCANAGPKGRIAPPGEPGVPLRISGRVFRPDGQTPAVGVIVYAYQTDKNGVYNKPGEMTPRLRAWVKTDADGRFELESIRPGQYPGGRVPAHIHFQCWGTEVPAQATEELRFADDPLVEADEKRRSAAQGRFAWVVTTVNGRVEVNLRLKKEGSRFEEANRHGLASCAS